jgi:3-oxoacyl-[acyl-carrier-protein] synthase III
MSGNVIIESLAVHLPSREVSTRDVLAGCADTRWLTDERVARVEYLTGIRRRRMADDGEGSVDLAARAIAKCLATSAFRPADVDLLISCSISRYIRPNHSAFEPSIASRLCALFGFDRALAFDVANGCAGMFSAIMIAQSLMTARLVRVALIVSGEHITDLTKTAQRDISGRPLSDPRFACLTLGDSSAAMILHTSPTAAVGFQAIDLYTAAVHHSLSVAKPADHPHGGFIMAAQSVKLFEVAIRHSTTHATHLLRKSLPADYRPDWIVIHQAAESTIAEVVRQMNELAQREMCSESSMIVNMAERGNTATTSHFVAMWDNMASGKIRAGDDVLFGIQGSGLTIGTALYTVDDLPDRITRVDAEPAAGRPAELRRGPARVILRIGAPRIRIASVGTAAGATEPGTGVGLARAAIDRCLRASSYGKDDVELLIYSGVYRDDFIGEPAVAAMIAGQAKLNDAGVSAAGKKTFAFDLLNGALGFLNGCCVGAGMIQAGDYRTVMVVASEIENNARIPGAPRRGVAEAGSAVILDHSPDGAVGFGTAVFMSFPQYADALTSWVVNEDGRPILRVERRSDLEDIYLECVSSTVEELLRQEALGMADVAAIVPPSVSAGFGARLAEALNVERDRVLDAATDGGELFSSAIAYGFARAITRPRARAGDIALMISVGSGIQAGAALYYL